MAQMTLSELRNGAVRPAVDTEIGFQTVAGFEALQRMANIFAESPITPDTFRAPYTVTNYRGEAEQRGCENKMQAIGACAIALDMALRMHANPLMVMQNLYVVHGRPAWSAKFLIATLNKSGKFSALKYDFQGKEGMDDWGCKAVATELATGEIKAGPLITIKLAKLEGWFDKKGSKWRTMPEVMLRYRAAAWFVNAYAPEIAMGLPEVEELRETIDITPDETQEQAQHEQEESTVTVEDITKKVKRGRKPKAEAAPAPDPAPEQEQESTPQMEPEHEPVQEPEAEPATMPEPQPERNVTPMGSYAPPSAEYDAKEDAFYAQK